MPLAYTTVTSGILIQLLFVIWALLNYVLDQEKLKKISNDNRTHIQGLHISFICQNSSKSPVPFKKLCAPVFTRQRVVKICAICHVLTIVGDIIQFRYVSFHLQPSLEVHPLRRRSLIITRGATNKCGVIESRPPPIGGVIDSKPPLIGEVIHSTPPPMGRGVIDFRLIPYHVLVAPLVIIVECPLENHWKCQFKFCSRKFGLMFCKVPKIFAPAEHLYLHVTMAAIKLNLQRY